MTIQDILKTGGSLSPKTEYRSWSHPTDSPLKSRLTSDHSSQDYSFGAIPGFRDVLRENVASGYVGIRRSFDWGLSFNASAKEEYFHSAYRSDWHFIPQLGITYYRTPTSIFQMNVTALRVYPSYWELHGGTNHINDYSSVTGNPALKPYIDYSAQASYILHQK